MIQRLAPPGASGLYDPAKRARFVWHRARGQAVGRGQPCRRREGTRGAREPRAPRRRGGRSEHRRRRRDPGSDPRRLPESGGRRRRAAAAGPYGVGVCYLPADAERRVLLEQLIEETIEAEGQRAIWWRDVPVDERHVGDTARLSAPVIRQVLIEASDEIEDQDAFERKLYVIRRLIERSCRRRPRAAELLEPDDGLQGDADRPAAASVLHRPARSPAGVAARARALALLDEHVPELGARPPLPDDRPQRRGQHAARQRQLDAGPRVAARLGAVRR